MVRDYDTFLNLLRKNGWDESANQSDFYFQYRKKIDPQLYGDRVSSDEWAEKVRWRSTIGIECVAEIRSYFTRKIQQKQKERTEELLPLLDDMMTDPNWGKKLSAAQGDFYATIDFNDFSFHFDDRSWNLNDFVYHFPMQHRLGGLKDLMGIDLSGIQLFNCRLVDLCFDKANLDNAMLNQVELVNTSFRYATFHNATLEVVRLRRGACFDLADMTGTGVYGLFPLDDHSLKLPFEYKEVSYSYLVLSTVKSLGCALLRKKTNKLFGRESGKHTAFANNPTTEMTLPQTRPLTEYIKWYQHTMEQIIKLPKASTSRKLTFLVSVVSTKYWTSYGALALSVLILNLIFTAFYYLLRSYFCEMPKNLMSIFYASVLIFTSLGVEGLRTCTTVSQILVMTEAVLGFVMLGLFVYLLTRKIEKQY
jgi:hypothetical protein